MWRPRLLVVPFIQLSDETSVLEWDTSLRGERIIWSTRQVSFMRFGKRRLWQGGSLLHLVLSYQVLGHTDYL